MKLKKSRLVNYFEKATIFLLLFLLPTQLGKHFFFDFSYINGIKIDYLSIAIYTTDLLAAFLLVLYWRAFFDHIRKYKAIFFTLSFLSFINILQSQQPIIAIYTIIKLLEIYFLFFLFRYRKTSLIEILTPLFFGALFESALTILQYINHGSIQGIFYYFGERILSISTPGIAKTVFMGEQVLRPYGTFSHPNSLGGFYMLVYALCLFLHAKTDDKQAKVLIYFLVIFSSMLVFISFSKTVIITYVVVTLLYFLAKDRQRHKEKNFCLLCAILKMLIPITVAFIFIQTQSDPTTLEKRLMLLQQSVQIIFKTFFLGTGFGQYLYYQSSYPTPYSYFFLQPVHNIFILFFLQAGVVMTTFVAYCSTWFLLRYYKYIPYFFLVIFITGLFDHYWLTLQQNMLVFGVIFGFGTRLGDVTRVSDLTRLSDLSRS